ncbi:MAG TPA: MerC domain-containing protein [Myxococcales bacterium]|nr:MerC domain-containing protein [Myxococcales bacterium]
MIRDWIGSIASWFLPVAACSTCPACLSVYAGLFSCLGGGFALTERTHGIVLGIALFVAVTMSVIAALRHRRWAPPILTGLGSVLLLVSHLYFDHLILEVAGTASLIAGNVWGVRLRRHVHGNSVCTSGCSHEHFGRESLTEGS